MNPEAKKYLINFFSLSHKQSTVYTCGPTVVKMIVDYYKFLSLKVKNSPLNPIDKALLDLNNENFLCKLFECTEEHGTEATVMAKKLTALGCSLRFGQANGLKKVSIFPPLFEELLNEGIPIIVNYTYHLLQKDKTNKNLTVGHYGVLYSITKKNIFIADPAAHFELNIKKEEIRINEFLEDWRSGSGEPGVYLIIYPNKQIYEKFSELNLLLSE